MCLFIPGGSLLDLASLVVELSRQRRGGVQDKEHLHFLFSAALYYAQDVLMKSEYYTDCFPILEPTVVVLCYSVWVLLLLVLLLL